MKQQPVVAVAHGADRGQGAGVGESVRVPDGGVLGGFLWSSQDLEFEGVADDEAEGGLVGSGWEGAGAAHGQRS